MKNNYLVREILFKYGIIETNTELQYNIPCIFHDEKNGDSLSISISKGIFKCFSGKCDKKGSLTYLLKLLGYSNSLQISINQFEQILNDKKKNIDSTYEQNKIKSYININNFDTYKFEKYHYISNKYLHSTFNLDTFSEERGINKEILKKNFIYYSDYLKRYIMPFWFNKKCYGVVGRTVLNKNDIEFIENILFMTTKEKLGNNCIFSSQNIKSFYKLISSSNYRKTYPEIFKEHFIDYVRYRMYSKYWNNSGLPRNELIYIPLTNKGTSEIFIVESILNALSLNEVGFDSIAILGSQTSLNQINLIKQIYRDRRKITCFDNDNAGFKARKEFNKKIRDLTYHFNLPNQFNDINEFVKHNKKIEKQLLRKYILNNVDLF